MMTCARIVAILATPMLATSLQAMGSAAGPMPPMSLGPVWQEECDGQGTDAGSLPADSQVTGGAARLTAICGSLAQSGSSSVDFEDMYLVRICDPGAFRASTLPPHGGFADFNTQLWLFRPEAGMPAVARGLLGNDDAPGGGPGSVLLPAADDGSGAMIAAPGLYHLAISAFPHSPTSPGGPIFFIAVPDEISGPDGPGGLLPITGWGGPGGVGNYVIALEGTAHAFGVTVDCNCNGVYDNCDIVNGTSLDENGNGIPDECERSCPEDIDGSETVDISDLLVLLGGWGTEAGDVTGDCTTDVADLLAVLAAWGPCG